MSSGPNSFSKSGSGSAWCQPGVGATIFSRRPAAPQVADLDVDATLTRELNELSVKEREDLYEEIHGISAEQKDPEERELDKIFVAMQERICTIRKPARAAYEKALFLRPDYVQNRKFRLSFLRAEDFDPHKAAQRFVKHFEYKRELFGDGKLVEDVTLQDLTPADLECLMSGSTQILPQKDSVGRTVIVVNQNYYRYRHWKEQLRVTWYIIQVALEDEVSQTRGLVDVIVDIGPNHNEFDLGSMAKRVHLMNGLPFRLSGWHYCYNSPVMQPFMQLAQVVLGRQARLRFRQHRGSHLEVIYALMSFGISPASIPFTGSGGMKLEPLEQFCRERQVLEDQRRKEESTSGIIYPKYNDVLFGKGRPYQEWTGNLQLKTLIDQCRDEYNSSDRLSKTALSRQVVHAIRENGGRFLKRDNSGTWQEITDEAVAREKVSHAFRIKTKMNSSTIISHLSSRPPESVPHENTGVFPPEGIGSFSNNSSGGDFAGMEAAAYDDFNIVGSSEDHSGPWKRFKL